MAERSPHKDRCQGSIASLFVRLRGLGESQLLSKTVGYEQTADLTVFLVVLHAPLQGHLCGALRPEVLKDRGGQVVELACAKPNLLL